jgi:threonine dehydrogenase-like Zn-dependent dehydrogenase
MRACAFFPASKELLVVDHPEPRLERPTDVLARVLEVGICGTDREIARGEHGVAPPGEEYLVIGHESLVEILAAGDEVTELSAGDLAVPMVRRPCASQACIACRTNRADFCLTEQYAERGIVRRHGYMAERIVDDARWFVRVPPELREVGVLLEPMTVGVKAMIEARGMTGSLPWLRDTAQEHRARTVVVGAGAVGLLAAMALRARGFDTWVWSREPEGSPQGLLIQAIGGHYRSNAGRELAELAPEVGNISFIFEATGVARVAAEAAKVLGPNGALCLSGVFSPTGPVAVELGSFLRTLVLRNQRLFGTVNAGPSAFRAAVEVMGDSLLRWPRALTSVISSRHPLDEVPDLLRAPPAGTKSVVRIAPG